MKNKLLILFFLCAGLAYSQSPQLINYQGIARGSDGVPVTDQDVGLQFEILQGSTTGSVVFSEQQAVKTNSLGLISTKIGSVGNLGGVNWGSSTYYIKVSADFTGGTNYTSLGTQQIMSVPFALHAASVPGAYTPSTNVITLGGNTFTLSSTPITTIVPGGIASVTTTGTNSFVIAVPEPTFTSSGPVTVSGTYPNLTVTSPTVPPTTTVSAAGIATVNSSATNSFVVGVPQPTFTSVTAAGQVSITGTYPNLTVSSPTVPPTTTVGAAGIATVSNVSTNSFVVGVPQPTFSSVTAAGQVSITGTYPNLTVSSPTVPPTTTVGAAGIATVSNVSTNSFVVGVPQPTFTSAGPVTISGTYPNLTVTSPAVPPTTTVTGINNAIVTSPGTNSFVVNVPQPSISISSTVGATNISGAGTNSFNINIPAGVTPTISGAGALSVGPATVGNTFVLTVPATSVTMTQSVGATTVSSAGTNSFNINVAPVDAPSITALGVLTSTPSGSSFTLSVPGTSITTSGVAGVTSSGTNSFDISVPGTSLTSTGVASITPAGTNSFNIGVPGTSLTSSGVASVTTAGTNSFDISVPGTSLTSTGVASVTASGTNSFNISVPGTSLTSSGIASVTPAGTNSFVVDVPAPVYTSSGPVTITGIYPNLSVNSPTVSPTTTINAAGAVTVSNPSTNSFVISVPVTTITQSGAAQVTSSGSNTFNVHVPVTSIAVTSTAGSAGVSSAGTNSFNINVPTPTINATGLAIATSTGNAFTVNVPVLTYNAGTGALVSGANSVNIIQPLTLSGNTITSGPSSNSVNLSAIGPWRQAAGSVTLATATDKVDIGGAFPAENLQVESTGNTSVSVLSGATGASELSFGTSGNHASGRIRYDNALSTLNITTGNTADRLFIDASGNVALGQNFTVAKLDVNGNIRANGSRLFLGAVGGVNSGYTGIYENSSDLVLAVGKSGAAATSFGVANSYDAVTIKSNTGFVGIGVAAPTENLQVQSAGASSLSIVSGTGNSDLFFGNTTTHSLGRIRYDNTTHSMSFWTNSASRMDLNATGQVIIGSNATYSTNTGLTISRNGALNNQLMITGGDNTNTFGGILSFAENLNYVGGMSIKLDAAANKLLFTTDLPGVSPIMAIGGYAGVPAGVAIGAGFVGSNAPTNGLIVQGNVGFGTSTPARKLEVASGTSALSDNQGQSTFYHYSGIGNAVFAESNNTGNAPGSALSYARGMLAGINANSPFGNMNSGVWGSVTGQGSGGYGVMASYGNFGTYSTYVGLAGVQYSGLFMGGNVGIGTMAPTAALHVVGNGVYTGNVGIGTTAPTAALHVVGSGLYTGNVGIQNPAPTAPLEVGTAFAVRLLTSPSLQTFRSVNYAPMLEMNQGFGQTAYMTSNDDWATSAVEYFFGSGVPSGEGVFRAGADNSKSLGSGGVRWSTVFAANGVINTSDAREKHNVRNLNYGLNEVMQLRPVVFNWNSDPKNQDKIGLIAQEVQAVIGEVVKGGEDWGPKYITNEKGAQVPNPNYADRLGIFYSDLIPVVIKAMQEQQAIIDAQKAKLDALENRLNALERK